MKKAIYSVIFLFSVLILSCCSGGQNRQYSFNSWNISVDLKSEKISLKNNNLGTVLDSIQLQTIREGATTRLSDWKIRKTKDGFIIRTNNPITSTWNFIISENRIDVSTSAEGAHVTAIAPASINRFPARIADSASMLTSDPGKRIDYTGVTNEVEKYYVPLENPNVMYLSLGAIESPNLHSLFDKQTNTVIQFSSASKITRVPEDHTLVQVSMPVGDESFLLNLIPEYYTKVLGMPKYVPYDDTYHKTAPTGWNSWLAFFRQVTEKDMVQHADFIAKNMKSFGMVHCQLDDGYDHDERRLWNKNWDSITFPNGPEWLAKYIKSKGLIPGLWTVPYSYSVKDANPDWFLRDDEGKILINYGGGGELDFSREDVIQEYWIPLWKEFKRQGWEFHKFDMGRTARMWQTYEHNFQDTTLNSYEVATRSMKVWKEIMGPEVWHTNHPDADGGRVGFLDVAGCGRDPDIGWLSMTTFLGVISNNSYQNHIVWYSDPDCILLRGKPTRADFGRERIDNIVSDFLTFEEARTCASLLSLSGMSYLSGDDLLTLEEDRLDLIKRTIPTMPVFPIDLFGRGRDYNRYPEIVDLKVNQISGIYDVIAVTNWQNTTVSRSVSFEKDLALDPDQNYIVFDFWKEQMTGIFSGKFDFEIPAHGTRVFLVHKQMNKPQLIGTNRHISGAFGITKNVWDESQMTLNGISETVPGVKYSLYFSVPKEFIIDKVEADSKNVTQKLLNDGLLELSFTGQEPPVSWNLNFIKK
jgi:hypothetical protein